MKSFRSKVLTAFLLAVVGGGFVTENALAMDTEFYSGNDILFYDKNACNANVVSTDPGTVAEGDNLQTILKYFTGKGLTLAQAAGIAGNMKQESGFDPAIIQGGKRAGPDYKPVNGVGFGLVQWTFTSRQQPLVDLAKKTNRKITDITLQLDNVWRELNGGYKKTLQALVKTNDPVQAAIIVHGPPWPGYEASADSASFVRRVRGGNAQKYYDQFKGKIADGKGVQIDGDTTTPGSGGASGTTNCPAATASDFSDDGFTVYDQCDPRWANVAYSYKTACSSGCGPTAMAAAITALTGKAVTPDQTVKFASSKGMYESGVGTKHHMPTVVAAQWNINAKSIGMSVDSINKVLKSGGLVIIAGTGGAPFTGAGHYILIRAVTESGKWKIADSNGKIGQENSKKEWDPRGILVNAHASSVYALTK